MRFQQDEIFSLLSHRVSAVCWQVVVFLHRSSSQSQNSCVPGRATATPQPELLYSVLYGERCLSNSLPRKPWKSISVGCAAGVIDSGFSRTKERGLHIYVHASPGPAVDSVLWSSMTVLGKGSDSSPQCTEFGLSLVNYAFNTVGYTEEFGGEGCSITMTVIKKWLRLRICCKVGLFSRFSALCIQYNAKWSGLSSHRKIYHNILIQIISKLSQE